MDSFHCHLDELERIVQNNEGMKELLEQDCTLCLAAHVGSNQVVETLIRKGVGKEYIYHSVPQIRPPLAHEPPPPAFLAESLAEAFSM